MTKYKSVGWHCTTTNIGSYKTAEKIGYERVREYKKFGAYFNQVDNWVVNGFLKFQSKEYKEAIKWYEKIIDAANKETSEYLESYYMEKEFLLEIYFRLSTFYCKLGNKKRAVQYLRRTIENGYKEENQLLRSELLKPLHGTEEWNELIQLIRKNIKINY